MITDQSVIQLPGSYAVDHMALIDRRELQDATVFDSTRLTPPQTQLILICRFPFADDSAAD